LTSRVIFQPSKTTETRAPMASRLIFLPSPSSLIASQAFFSPMCFEQEVGAAAVAVVAAADQEVEVAVVVDVGPGVVLGRLHAVVLGVGSLMPLAGPTLLKVPSGC
jgi:hypothetical protein